MSQESRHSYMEVPVENILRRIRRYLLYSSVLDRCQDAKEVGAAETPPSIACVSNLRKKFRGGRFLLVSYCVQRLKSPVFPTLQHHSLPCLRWLGPNGRAMLVTASLQRRPKSPKVPARCHRWVRPRTTLFHSAPGKMTRLQSKDLEKAMKVMAPRTTSFQRLLSPTLVVRSYHTPAPRLQLR